MEDMGPRPLECNGLGRLDAKLNFMKINCAWTVKTCGRKQNAPNIKLKKDQPFAHGKIKEPKTICLSLDKKHLDFIKRQALQRSVEDGTPIAANALIREALERAFPMPQQLDFFGGK